MSVYQLAHDFAFHTNRILFIAGKAGTGKTTFLHRLKNESVKQVAVVAPTGVAAINAGGTTIHSFFQLPLSPFIPTPEGQKELIGKMKMQSRRRQVLRELELLIIDEISMVRADVLDAIDTVLRHVRYRHDEPFGGVQVIFIGDMFQLSPVAKPEEWQILQPYYPSVYFFHSQVVRKLQLVHIEFDKIFRQSNATFIGLLEEIRLSRLSEEGRALLNSRYNPSFVPPDDENYIVLTTHNYKADNINFNELANIDETVFSFDATVKGDFPERNYPADARLELKKGAKVMFIKNDNETPRRFYNGKIGIVAKIDKNSIEVQCPGDDEPIQVSPMLWENINYTVNKDTAQLEENTVGSFSQIPLRLAWAITIHKSQGLTFDKVVVDAGASFAPGQVYVALSRCRTLEGLVLKSRIGNDCLMSESKIVDFSEQNSPADELTRLLETSRQQYKEQLLMNLYTFASLQRMAQQLLTDTRKVESSFNKETVPFLQGLLKNASDLADVSQKFRRQLAAILAQKDNSKLTERLSASSEYFSTQLTNLRKLIAVSPAVTDSRENARDYENSLLALDLLAAQKLHAVQKLNRDFSIDDYFRQRAEFTYEQPTIRASASTYNRQTDSKHPELLWELTEIRNRLAEESGAPIYLIAKYKSLQEMADFLPQTPKELSLIHGFGKIKVQKFGAEFLDAINEYCREKGLSSQIQFSDGWTKEANKKPKQKKGDSANETFALFKDGKSVEEIAQERKLVPSTIAGHLAIFVKTGQLDVDQVLSSEKREKAMKVIKNKPAEVSAYEALASVLSNTEYRFFSAWLEFESKKQ